MKDCTPEQRKKIDKIIEQGEKEAIEYYESHKYEPNTLDAGDMPPFMKKVNNAIIRVIEEK